MNVQIMPNKSITYPDNGGYTGFCISVWEPYFSWEPRWGGIGVSVIEGRFFAFGVLLKRVLEITEDEEKHRLLADELFSKWKPIMDKITAKTNELHQEEGRLTTHLDEVVDERIKREIEDSYKC